MRECIARRGEVIEPQAPVPKKPVPAFAGLSSKYKLPDHQIYPKATSTLSTLEQEYEKFKNDPLSPEETDLVAFWQVYTICFTDYLDFYPLCFTGSPKGVSKGFPCSYGLPADPSVLCSMRTCLFISRRN